MLFSNGRTRNDTHSTILDGLRLLCEPGEVYELRCPRAGRHGTVSGYFNDLGRMASFADRWSGAAPAVYLTINPVKPALLARAANRIEPRASSTTADHDVLKRRRLLL